MLPFDDSLLDLPTSPIRRNLGRDRRATPLRRRQIPIARSHVRLCAKARVTGVAFFDFDHGQTGVAPNAIKLHPILGFRCRTG